MIGRIITLIRKDFLIFLSDKVAIALGFIVPMVMILVFGLVFGGQAGDGMDALEVMAVNQDQGPAGQRLLTALDKTDELTIKERVSAKHALLDSAGARRLVMAGKASVAIVIPQNFSEQLLEGHLELSTLEDTRDKITSGVVSGLLQQTLFTTFPALLPQSMLSSSLGSDSSTRRFTSELRGILQDNFGVILSESNSVRGLFPESFVLGAKDTANSGFGFGKIMTESMSIKREQVVGEKIVNPGIAQSVAGPAVMFMLFAVGAIAASLLREMRGGTAQRILSGRATAAELLISKYGYAVLLGSVQLIAMMLYGKLIFGLDIFHQPAALIAVIISAAAATSSVGLLIAALSRTEEQASGIQVVIILGMSAIGGAMFPSFMIPKAVRSLAQGTPVHWAMQGFLDVFWRDQGLSGVAFECGVLLAMGAVLTTISVIIFRRRLSAELG